MIGLIIPTRIEAGDVIRLFGFKKESRALYRGVIEGHAVWLAISGVGADAAIAASALLCRHGAKMLVSAGFCGALVPGLQVGEVVTERIRSVNSPVRTPEERRRLTDRAAVAVDMETQAIVEEGTRRGVPIRVLRVISDVFETDLSPLFDANSTFSPMAIAWRLLSPGVWPLAMHLYRSSNIARARLADELPTFVTRWAKEIPST